MQTIDILNKLISIEIELQTIKHNKQTKILKDKIMQLEKDKYTLENAVKSYSVGFAKGIIFGALVTAVFSVIMHLLLA